MKKMYLFLAMFLFLGISYAGVARSDTSPKQQLTPEQLKVAMSNPFMTKSMAVKLGLITPKPVQNHEKVSLSKSFKGKTAHGYIIYDDNIEDVGVASFDLSVPEAVTVLYPEADGLSACAGSVVDGQMYCYLYEASLFGSIPISFVKINMTSGAVEEIADYGEMTILFSDMTYDYVTQKMYYISNISATQAELGTVSLVDGTTATIGAMSSMSTLACDKSGQLYGIGLDGKLYKINKADAGLTAIGATGETPKYIQSMDFDRDSNELYWAGCNASEDGFLSTVNTTTGVATRVGILGGNAEVTALSIPFTPAPNGAPEAATNLVVTPGASGAMSAVISFNTPSTAVGGGTLAPISKVEVFRGETLVKTFSSPAHGSAQTFTDTPTEAALYMYKVVATNATGAGLPAMKSVFVGEDKAGAPTNVVLTKNGTVATINWVAPTTGLNGGWFDAPAMTYTVRRMPDNVVVAANITATTCTETLAVLGNYHYTVQSKTMVGPGGIGTSNVLVIGNSLTPPYTGLNDQADFALWTVIDANSDGKTWTWGSAATYSYHSTNAANDWLISPPIQLVSGKSYRIKYSIKSSVLYPENIEIKIGKGATAAAQTTLLQKHEGILLPAFTEQSVMYTPTENSNFNIGFRAYSDADKFNLSVGNVIIEELVPNDLMALTIKGDATIPVGTETKYVVTIKNNGSATQSSYSIKLVKEDGTQLTTKAFTTSIAANATLECEVPYTSTVAQDVKVFGQVVLTGDQSPTNDRTPAGIDVSFKNGYVVTGKVIDPLGANVQDATVKVSKVLNYEVKTAADGTFSIPSVIEGTDYTLSINKTGFAAYSSTFSVNGGNVDLGTLQLADKALTPRTVVAVDNSSNVKITWEEGSPTDIYRYDDGVCAGQLGFETGTVKSVMGSVHRTPTVLTNMSWWTVGTEEAGGPHNTINLYVLDLSPTGAPTSTVLFSKMAHPNTDDQWNTFEFTTPINCPRGFMIAVSYEGFAGIGRDAGTSTEWPFVPNANYYAGDYTSGTFTVLGTSMPYNFLIRAEGMPSKGGEATEYTYAKSIVKSNDVNNSELVISGNSIEPVVAAGYPENNIMAAKSFAGYKVYRFLQENEANQESWTELTANPLTVLEYTDNTWSSAPQGAYKYGVKGVYSNNVMSSPGISNMIAKGMSTAITVNVATNTPTNEANGAAVVITNKDGNAEHVYQGTVANGKVVFNNVWKGKYDLSITLAGFNGFTKTDLDWSVNSTYEVGPYTLTEIVIAPYNLEIIETGIATERVFNWNVNNNIEDDFESITDFEINPRGECGWGYIDADGSATYGFQGVQFPGVGSPMAFIAFNPTTTVPPIDSPGLVAHSGTKFLASFAAETPSNKDYFISPELAFASEFTFSFWAKTYMSDYGLERMRVAYSTTGNQAADFSNGLTAGNYVEVPVDAWTKYTFTVPASAKYVTVQCLSNDAFVFMLDDVFIGKGDSKAFTKYEVYLDGNKVGETTNTTTYTFTNLTQGNHVAGVKSVYTSETTELQTVSFNVTGTVNKYKVTYNTPENGTLKVLNGTVNVASGTLIEEGTKLTIEATPNAGYEVKTLTANGANIVNNSVTVGNAAVDIFAEFAMKQYTVTVTQAPNGVITVKKGTVVINSGDKVNHGTEITIVAIPASSAFKLAHITINGNALAAGVNKYKVMEDVTVSASFEPVGVIDVDSKINLSLYPNPVKDILHVEGEYQSLEIYDVNGRLILTADGEATVNVSNLTKGTYIIKAKNNDKVGTYKIIK